MRLFGTWYWGFEPERHPFAGFSTSGGRDRLLRLSNPGDRLVVVATQDKERVRAENRRRILGMVEFSRTVFDVEDYFPVSSFEPHLVDTNGRFIWPHAVGMLRAWRFTPAPFVNDVIGRNLRSSAMQTVDEINDEEAAAILALSATEIDLPQLPARVAGARLNVSRLAPTLLRNAPGQPGPPPSEWSAEVQHADGPTATYLAQFGKNEVWKMGISQNPAARIRALNFSIPEKLTGCKWELRKMQTWPNGQTAYDMEQTILRLLAHLNPEREQVYCHANVIDKLWNDFMAGSRSTAS